MFESIDHPDLAARIRGLGALPLAAVIVEQVAFTIEPLFGGLPRWIIVAIEVFLFVGAGDALIRAPYLIFVERRNVDAIVILWLVAIVALALFSGWQFFALVFPGKSF